VLVRPVGVFGVFGVCIACVVDLGRRFMVLCGGAHGRLTQDGIR
jgi:hypothetical protein